MPTRLRIILFIICAFCSSATFADFFSCKDSAGRLITSDHPIAECSDKTLKVHANNGVVKKSATDAFEKAQRRNADAIPKEESKEEKQVQKDKLYLLTHYPNLSDIEEARHKAISILEEKIKEQNRIIANNNNDIAANRNQQVQAAKTKPGDMMHLKFAENQLLQIQADAEKMIANYRQEQQKTNLKFEALHKQYIDLGLNEK